MRGRRRFVLLLVLMLLLSVTGQAFASDIHWTYEGEAGPEHWGELSPEFEACSSGIEQSPIDLDSTADANPADLQFAYQASPLTIVNNGHTIQVNYDEGSTLQVDGQTYNLLQFHFHNASEHTVDSGATPMEMHLVHSNDAGELAVVGLFLNEGDENVALAPVFENMPADEGEPVAVDGVTVDAGTVLPSDQSYWRYDGSLTTPPCSEGVKWFVMTTPIEASPDQIAAYTNIYSNNARPTQPMNDRTMIIGSMMAEGDMAEGDMPTELPETGAMSVDLTLTMASVLAVFSVLATFTAMDVR